MTNLPYLPTMPESIWFEDVIIAARFVATRLAFTGGSGKLREESPSKNHPAGAMSPAGRARSVMRRSWRLWQPT